MRKKYHFSIWVLLAAFAAGISVAISAVKKSHSWYQEVRDLYYGIPVQVRYCPEDPALSVRVWAYLESIDDVFNDYKEGSEIFAVNRLDAVGEVELSPETAREYHGFLIRQVVRMLCIGLIHGDLSEFNVLVAPDGPVIIDLPQAVNAAGNNAARAMLERDVNNLRATLGRFAPELLVTEFAREMWALFEQGELQPDSALTGIFAPDETVIDPDSVLIVIDDAREEELQRRLSLVG